MYLVNKTDKVLMFSVNDVSVNGFMCDPFWASEVPVNAREYTSMSWFSSSFEENGITDVKEIELTFRVYDSNDWFAKDVYKETVILNP